MCQKTALIFPVQGRKNLLKDVLIIPYSLRKSTRQQKQIDSDFSKQQPYKQHSSF